MAAAHTSVSHGGGDPTASTISHHASPVIEKRSVVVVVNVVRQEVFVEVESPLAGTDADGVVVVQKRILSGPTIQMKNLTQRRADAEIGEKSISLRLCISV